MEPTSAVSRIPVRANRMTSSGSDTIETTTGQCVFVFVVRVCCVCVCVWCVCLCACVCVRVSITQFYFPDFFLFLSESCAYFHTCVSKTIKNKKVLLRERKRHTARRVASARYAGWGGGLPRPGMVGGYPIQSWWGVPHLVMVERGIPHPVMVGGYPPTILTWPGGEYMGVEAPSRPGCGDTWGTPPPSRPGWGTPPPSRPGQGTPPTIKTWLRYPPPSRPGQGGTGGTPHHPDLAGVSPHHPDLARVLPQPSRPGGGIPHHPDQAGVPPSHHQDLVGVPPAPPSRPGWGTPSVEIWTDKQTENSTFPHPSDASGN